MRLSPLCGFASTLEKYRKTLQSKDKETLNMEGNQPLRFFPKIQPIYSHAGAAPPYFNSLFKAFRIDFVSQEP